MELKLIFEATLAKSLDPFNRTIVELKHTGLDTIDLTERTFNRTIVELKLPYVLGHLSNTGRLLIVPLWN